MTDQTITHPCPSCGGVALQAYPAVTSEDAKPVGQIAFDYCDMCGWCLHCDLYGDTHQAECPVHGWQARDSAYQHWLQ